jgi:hypothetical protein
MQHPLKPDTFHGMNVQVSHYIPDKPNFQLSKDCPCHDDFRQSFNLWLQRFFGTHKDAYIIGNTVYMCPEDHDKVVAYLQRSITP